MALLSHFDAPNQSLSSDVKFWCNDHISSLWGLLWKLLMRAGSQHPQFSLAISPFQTLLYERSDYTTVCVSSWNQNSPSNIAQAWIMLPSISCGGMLTRELYVKLFVVNSLKSDKSHEIKNLYKSKPKTGSYWFFFQLIPAFIISILLNLTYFGFSHVYATRACSV